MIFLNICFLSYVLDQKRVSVKGREQRAVDVVSCRPPDKGRELLPQHALAGKLPEAPLIHPVDKGFLTEVPHSVLDRHSPESSFQACQATIFSRSVAGRASCCTPVEAPPLLMKCACAIRMAPIAPESTSCFAFW